MSRFFRQVLSVFVVVVLAALAWGRRAGITSSEEDNAANCAMLFMTAQGEAPHPLGFCQGWSSWITRAKPGSSFPLAFTRQMRNSIIS
jgi:hypothetical protein